MRLVFIGASRFGLRCLESVGQLAEWDVAGVVTAPERFSISYNRDGVVNVLHADVESYCLRHSLPCSVIQRGMSGGGLLETVTAWRPDAFLVVGWYHMIPPSWLAVAPAYALHASLLPDYSGGAPLVWAMINGEKRTGITLFQLANGVDNGPIVAQAAVAIEPSDTIASLYGAIETAGLDLVATHLPALARGAVSLVPQDESKRRVFPQRSPADGLIDWHQSAARLHDFVRAQTRPYPGAFTLSNGRQVRIWAAAKGECVLADRLQAGSVELRGDRLFVKTGEGTLELLDIEIEGQPTGQSDGLRQLATAGILGG
jgi:methionyl-tRNA formyltransferase